MAKILIHLNNSAPRCGRCGRITGEIVDGPMSSHTQREKAKADSVFRPMYACRTDACSQKNKFFVLDPIEVEEFSEQKT